jgi:alpha-glucosidase
VLNNHDMPRSVTRYGGGAPGVDAGDVDLGTSRARASAVLMLALPGSAGMAAIEVTERRLRMRSAT